MIETALFVEEHGEYPLELTVTTEGMKQETLTPIDPAISSILVVGLLELLIHTATEAVTEYKEMINGEI